MSDRYIVAAGDRPKVERTRQWFAALRAGLKTSEETSYFLQREIGAQEEERAADRVRKALDDADVNRFGSAWYALVRRQDVERVLDENERLRKALRFYSALRDNGQTARDALAA